MLLEPERNAVLQAAQALPGHLSGSDRVRIITALAAWKRLEDCFLEQVAFYEQMGVPEPRHLHWHTFIVPEAASFRAASDAKQAFRLIAEWNPCLQGHAEVLAPDLSDPELDAARAALLDLDWSERATEFPDVVGLSYEVVKLEYLRSRNDRGEFFTPCNVVRLMVDLTQPAACKTLHDPACGSGRMFQEAARYVRRRLHGESLVPVPLGIVAQDIQPFMAAMTQFSLLALGYSNAVCIGRDSIREPVTSQEIHAILREREAAMKALRTGLSGPGRTEHPSTPIVEDPHGTG